MEEGEGSNVAVAVKLRPLVPSEIEQGSRECLQITPGQPQINTGQHAFTYDHVFGGDYGSLPTQLYPTCVAPLVDGLFKGYNATIFAYGQTGSGKTYTMGSEYRPGARSAGSQRMEGVIPEVIHAIFTQQAQQKNWQCSVRVSFVEIHKEEVRDLLNTSSGQRSAVSIREVLGGGVCLYGAVEREVRDEEEMAAVLEMGTLCRATASTSMNSRSSRSHAIFTISLEQRRQLAPATPGTLGGSNGANTTAGRGEDDDDEEGDDEEGGVSGDTSQFDDYLCAKMHLVDLAGSERIKRTKAEGARLKEGIHINRGLLALGNVINAIVDGHKHVPYRDSKLTRLLQDSLGGNSRTLMLACVSPADINFDESLNTLRYADRARHIRNKPTVNRDPVAAQVAHLRQQVAVLRAENLSLKAAMGGGLGVAAVEGRGLAPSGEESGGQWALIEQLQQERRDAELEATRDKLQLEEANEELGRLRQQGFLMQAQLERLERVAGGSQGAGDLGDAQDALTASYLSRIAELEKELRAARQFASLSIRRRTTQTGSNAAGGEVVPATPQHAKLSTPGEATPFSSSPGRAAGDAYSLGPFSEVEAALAGVAEEEEEEDGEEAAEEQVFLAEMAARTLEQNQMREQMNALKRLLEGKERRMAELQATCGGLPALKQAYDRQLTEVQNERDILITERQAIFQKLQHLQSASEEERRRLEATYKEKLATYDDKLRSLRHKEREYVSLQRLKSRTEDMCKRLNTDITKMKSTKVALQKSMETSAKQFAVWRQEREKELAQLRKQSRRKDAQIQALEAMQMRQNAVLQRKIADATAARKKLTQMMTTMAHTGNSVARGAERQGVQGMQRTASIGTGAGQNGEAQAHQVFRSEEARRDWLDRELDACNMSFEYRQILEGEIAQRTEALRQLKNVEKRLMMLKDLVPASPLMPGPAGLVTPLVGVIAAGGGDSVAAQALQQRKVQLETALTEHNMQISELNAALERERLEDFERGKGAADSRRWQVFRTLPDAQAMLKAGFTLACDLKSGLSESLMEGQRVGEEVELLRVQLDAARKEAEQQAKRAAAVQAAFSAVLSYHGLQGSEPHSAADACTEHDIDSLMHELGQQKARARKGVLLPEEDEGVQLGSPSSSHDGSVHIARTFTSPSRGLQGPVPAAAEGGLVPADLELQGRYQAKAAWADSQKESDSSSSSEESGPEEEEGESEEDVADLEWNPNQATPARPGQGRARRQSTAIRQPSLGELGRPRPSVSPQHHRRSSTSTAGTIAVLVAPSGEAAVLGGVNRARAAVGDPLVERLTVQVLKAELKGRDMPDGSRWRAGSKTRDRLMADYLEISGLDHAGHPARASTAPPTQPTVRPSIPTSTLDTHPFPAPLKSLVLPGLSPIQTVRPAGRTGAWAGSSAALADASGHWGSGGSNSASGREGGGTSPTLMPDAHSPNRISARDYKAAILSPGTSAGGGRRAGVATGSSWMGPLPSPGMVGGMRLPLLRTSVPAMGANASPRAGLHGMMAWQAELREAPNTPMSTLLLAKADESRQRISTMLGLQRQGTSWPKPPVPVSPGASNIPLPPVAWGAGASGSGIPLSPRPAAGVSAGTGPQVSSWRATRIPSPVVTPPRQQSIASSSHQGHGQGVTGAMGGGSMDGVGLMRYSSAGAADARATVWAGSGGTGTTPSPRANSRTGVSMSAAWAGVSSPMATNSSPRGSMTPRGTSGQPFSSPRERKSSLLRMSCDQLRTSMTSPASARKLNNGSMAWR